MTEVIGREYRKETAGVQTAMAGPWWRTGRRYSVAKRLRREESLRSSQDLSADCCSPRTDMLHQ